MKRIPLFLALAFVFMSFQSLDNDFDPSAYTNICTAI